MDLAEADRPAALRRFCPDDSAMRHEVEELLALASAPELAADRSQSPFGATSQHHVGCMVAGRYRLTRFVASGGMGDVFAAEDIESRTEVALKFIRLTLQDQAAAEARLEREVRMAQRIDHPNVCRVMGLGESNGARFCVMELLTGETLSERLHRQGQLPEAETIAVALQICAGLEAAHAAGVIHRDLKPGNIILTGDRVVIIDFGLAAAAPGQKDETRSLTSDGAAIGTLAYMAPEQLENGESSPASDLFAFGVILYEMLTGTRPHDAKSPFRLAAQKARESHQTPFGKTAGIPAVWQEEITRCLKACPEERFSSAAALRHLLERGKPTSRFLINRWTRRFRIPAAAGALLVLGGLTRSWVQADHAPPREAAAQYEAALAAVNQAAPVRATGLLEQAVQLDRKFVKASAALAVAYHSADQIDRAREVVIHATSVVDGRWFTGRQEQLALDAARAMVTYNYDGAAASYQQLSAQSQGSARNYFQLLTARMQELGGKGDRARETLLALIKHDPLQGQAARVRYGSILARGRKYEAADAEFARVKSECEQQANQECLGELLLARWVVRYGSPEEEKRDLERLLVLSAKTGNRYQNLTAQFRMAIVRERERDYEGAITAARAAAKQAVREQMPVVAARAMGELGYAFLYLKKPEQAVEVLGEAVELAERSHDPMTLAATRMKWGEVLGQVGRTAEALKAMEPAIAVYRQYGAQETLPLMLIKWATTLGGTARLEEGPVVISEALDLATRQGNELYQAMALQRLGNHFADRDLRQSAHYWGRAVQLADNGRMTGVFFQTAANLMRLGEFARARIMLDQGEREAAKYPPGVDRRNFDQHVIWGRASLAYYQGRCTEGLREIRGKAIHVAASEWTRAMLTVCAGGSAQEALTWAEARLAGSIPEVLLGSEHAFGGQLAWEGGDMESARRHAETGLAAAMRNHQRVYELQSLLVLRAVAKDDSELTSRVLDVSRKVGFDPPERFGGRYDLLRLWRAKPNARR